MPDPLPLESLLEEPPPFLAFLEDTLARRGTPPPKGWASQSLHFAPYGRVRVHLHPSQRHASPTYILHNAFLGELLLTLAPKLPRARLLPPERGPGELVPDAILWVGTERVALEVDLFYGRAKALRKARFYREAYDGQIWGVTSPRRRQDLLAAGWPKPVQVHLLDPKELLEVSA